MESSTDREKVINELVEHIESALAVDSDYVDCVRTDLLQTVVGLLKEQEGLLGIQQTADSITFISTGTAQQGEARGLLLGKLAMHEWLEKELLYRGLLTDDIRAVFDEAKRQ